MDNVVEEIKKENEEMQEFLSNIKASCPVYSYTVGKSANTSALIAGMYLICMDIDTIKDIVDKNALDDNVEDCSILFFERHHISELCSVLEGCLQIIKNNKYIDDGDIKEFVYELTKYTSSPKQYSELIGFMGSQITDLMKRHPSVPPEVFKRLKIIFTKIWFVPYNKIDDIARQAANIVKEDDSNE